MPVASSAALVRPSTDMRFFVSAVSPNYCPMRSQRDDNKEQGEANSIATPRTKERLGTEVM